jgi:hypothetical protein
MTDSRLLVTCTTAATAPRPQLVNALPIENVRGVAAFRVQPFTVCQPVKPASHLELCDEVGEDGQLQRKEADQAQRVCNLQQQQQTAAAIKKGRQVVGLTVCTPPEY